MSSMKRAASKLIEEFGYPLKIEADTFNDALKILKDRCNTYWYSLGSLTLLCNIYYKSGRSITRFKGEAYFYWDEHSYSAEFIIKDSTGIFKYSWNPSGTTPTNSHCIFEFKEGN